MHTQLSRCSLAGNNLVQHDNKRYCWGREGAVQLIFHLVAMSMDNILDIRKMVCI